VVHDRLLSAFSRSHGGAPDLIARAPGRVNLIGEHTDYNDGFVLPMAIGCQTRIAARKRQDGMITLVAADLGDARSSFSVDAPILPDAEEPWSNYARGVAHALHVQGLGLAGADVVIAGDVPQGLGLSSSASFEVAFGLALAALCGQPGIDRTALARAGQTAEHDFAGCKCGIMDQLVSARAEAGHALLIDCRSLEAQSITMPPDIAVMIVHSGIARGLVDGAYNLRRAQCEAAAAHYGVAALRDVGTGQLSDDRGTLDAETFRRARHVVSENARTCAAAEALVQHDLAQLGSLMAASHISMRDDFEITLPPLDALVDLLVDAIGGDGGARMTGGGFGGAVVALMPQSRVEPVREKIYAQYRTPSGTPPAITIETAQAGATIENWGQASRA
jgi:galactokinase